MEFDFEISSELKDLAEKIESSPDNFFVAGKAGTGKSTLVKYIQETSKKNWSEPMFLTAWIIFSGSIVLTKLCLLEVCA